MCGIYVTESMWRPNFYSNTHIILKIIIIVSVIYNRILLIYIIYPNIIGKVKLHN